MTRARAAVLVALLTLVAAGVALWIALDRGDDWGAGRSLWLARGSGWVALGALMAALVATPARRIALRVAPRAGWIGALPALRRAAGIAAATAALAHAALALSGWLDGAWAAVWSWPYLRAGLVALVILVLLLVTSFRGPVRLLRVRTWKPLHRLAYVAAALVLLHLMLSPFAPRVATLVLFGLLVLVGLGRLLPRTAPQRRRTADRPPRAAG